MQLSRCLKYVAALARNIQKAEILKLSQVIAKATANAIISAVPSSCSNQMFDWKSLQAEVTICPYLQELLQIREYKIMSLFV